SGAAVPGAASQELARAAIGARGQIAARGLDAQSRVLLGAERRQFRRVWNFNRERNRGQAAQDAGNIDAAFAEIEARVASDADQLITLGRVLRRRIADLHEVKP